MLRPADDDPVPRNTGGGAGPRLDRTLVGGGDVDRALAGAVDHGARHRMLGAGLRGGRHGEDVVLRETGERNDLGQSHLTLGHRAGLVEQDDIRGVGRLEHLAALEQDAELRAAAGPGHDRGGRRQAERARARDQQDRHRI